MFHVQTNTSLVLVYLFPEIHQNLSMSYSAQKNGGQSITSAYLWQNLITAKEQCNCVMLLRATGHWLLYVLHCPVQISKLLQMEIFIYRPLAI